MKKLNLKIELLTNILFIVVTIALAGIFIQRHFFPVNSTNQLANSQPSIGTKVNLPDVDFSKQSKTLILALQSTCHYCNESAPFYKRLLEAVQAKNTKLIAVLPSNVEESRAHLDELGLSSIEVKQAPLNVLQIIGTPTLILTNDKGEVMDSWAGKLSDDKELEVISKL